MIYFVLCFIASVFLRENNGVFSAEVRVINGQNATKGQFPWQVGILNIKSNMELLFCGGAIISEEWVLTSANCLYDAQELGVYSGVVDITDFDRVISTSSDYIIHEDFDSLTLQNDIGVIHLDPPLVFSDNTSAVVLSDEELQPGTDAIVTGWGHSNHDDAANVTDILQYASVSVLDNSDCEKIYGDVISPSIVCAIGDNPVKNPCFGDAGGPLVVNIDAYPLHVAIFSFVSAEGCDSYPAGYTRTAYFRNWIKEKTGV